MRLFLYGTLLDNTTLAERSGDPSLPARCQTAVLRGWLRVTLAGTPWPTLRRRARGVVAGTLVPVGAASVRRLMAYETPPYQLRRVVVETMARRRAVWTWIADGGTNRVWNETVKGSP